MWPFPQKKKVPFEVFIKASLTYLVETAPFLVFEELERFGDLGVLGEDTVHRLEREIIYYSIFLQIHFTLTRPYGLNRALNADTVGNVIDLAVAKALPTAPTHIRLNQETFALRYLYYLKAKDIHSSRGELGSLCQAFSWAVVGLENSATPPPDIEQKLEILLPMGEWIYTTLDTSVSGLLKETKLS